jgi:hypothetical protein
VNALFSKKSALSLALAVFMSTVINWSTNIGNVYTCPPSSSLACSYPTKLQAGSLNTMNYGYPVDYRKVVSFDPCHSSGQNTYCNASDRSYIGNRGVSAISVVIDVVFWFALFNTIATFMPLNGTVKSKKLRQK